MRRARYLWALAGCVQVALFSLVFRPRGRLTDNPLVEDAFYSLSVARNVALGHGVTVDGLHSTNGFQPLHTFAMVPGYLATGGDRFESLRFVYGWAGLSLALTALVLAAIARDVLQPDDARARLLTPLTVLLAICNLVAIEQFWNGLETGTMLALVSLLWLAYARLDPARTRCQLLLGAIAGAMVLARVDTALLVAMAAAAHLGLGAGSWTQRLRGAATFALVAAAVSGPWWAYNLLEHGSLMPSSGTAQTRVALDGSRVRIALGSLARLLTSFFGMYFPAQTLVRIAAFALLVIGALRALAGVPQPAVPERRQRALAFGALLCAYVGVLAVYYSVTSWATYFYLRYLTPALLVAVVIWSVCLAGVLARRSAAVIAPLTALALGALVFAVTHHRGEGLWSGGWQSFASDFYRNQVRLVADHVPDHEWVAASQTGTLGYFRDRVANLDGKVNGEILDFAGTRAEYMARHDIHHFCDWTLWYPEYFGGDPGAIGWRRTARRGEFVLLSRP